MLEPLPTIVPPQKTRDHLARGLPAGVAMQALARGWRDFRHNPAGSLAYGLALFVLSVVVVWALWRFHLLYLILPALAGFMIVGPFTAIGLYRKSSAIAQGQEMHLEGMRHARRSSAAQLAYAGLLLCLLLIFWLRAADLLYALFFGLIPFPGYEEALLNTFTTARGWGLLVSGGFVGAFFAGFAFSVSLFALPMIEFEGRDALTAMGTSFAIVMKNLVPCFAWGVIVTIGIGLSVVTGLLGLIIVFPVLGHGTWHMYRALRPEAGA
ncbi:MAG: DUF2189 domain-containing protein [Rubellimicrobium sp.]|nr:DUF2189 domain-containing protein [Rubellimicrobium sp.]